MNDIMKRRLRVGVIGAGAVAQACHIRGYARAANCELTAIADVEPACLAQVKKAGRVFQRTYSDWREMLQKEELDAISICTPNALHKEQAVAAIATGADILLEKPIAISLADARAILRAARSHKARVMVAFSHRFSPHNQRVFQEIHRGRIGRPYMIRVRFAHGGPYPGWAKTDWFYNPRKAGGGAVLDMGIHAFDLARWLIGDVTAVTARTATLRKKIKVDDNAVVVLEFGKTALGYIEVGWASPAGFCGIELMGDRGSIAVDYRAGRATMLAGRVDRDGAPVMRPTVLCEAARRDPWPAQMAHFIGRLGSKRPFDVGMDEGLAALQICLAAYKSARTGRRVKLRSL